MKADLKDRRHLTRDTENHAAEDLPGLGAFYCTECAKYFGESHSLNEHRSGKNHKRRVKLLKEEAHSQKLAEAAVGLGTDNGQRKVAQDGGEEMVLDTI